MRDFVPDPDDHKMIILEVTSSQPQKGLPDPQTIVMWTLIGKVIF